MVPVLPGRDTRRSTRVGHRSPHPRMRVDAARAGDNIAGGSSARGVRAHTRATNKPACCPSQFTARVVREPGIPQAVTSSMSPSHRSSLPHPEGWLGLLVSRDTLYHRDWRSCLRAAPGHRSCSYRRGTWSTLRWVEHVPRPLTRIKLIPTLLNNNGMQQLGLSTVPTPSGCSSQSADKN
ncbi:hypothetical protein RRG08_027849 [Elysia crispata]|uniref:Uncharacterized protein n=1 Tax=Elysia crispata TaxID=231223 RepID=A0AAE1D4A8_9GAST|nr:hypothetical protein RRG08_027849 [Elysia crispata]